MICHLHRGILKEWLGDHMCREKVTLPRVSCIEMCCAAAAYRLNVGVLTINCLVYSENEGWNDLIPGPIIGSKLTLSVQSDDTFEIGFCKLGTGGATPLAGGKIEKYPVVDSLIGHEMFWKDTLKNIRNVCNLSLDVSLLYSAYDAMGINFGPSFRLLKSVSFNFDKSLIFSVLSIPSITIADSYLISPPLLDAILQPSIVASQTNQFTMTTTH